MDMLLDGIHKNLNNYLQPIYLKYINTQNFQKKSKYTPLIQIYLNIYENLNKFVAKIKMIEFIIFSKKNNFAEHNKNNLFQF